MFPASTQIKVDGFQLLRKTANYLKTTLTTQSQKMLTDEVNGSFILYMLNTIKTAATVFRDVSEIPGIVEYVRSQYDDETMDVVAEFQTMLTLTESVGAWIINNLPTDGTGHLSIRHMDTDGNITERMFTPSHTIELRVQINNLTASIG